VILGSCESSVQITPWKVIDANSVFIFESNTTPILADSNFHQYFPKKAYIYLSAVQRSSKDGFEIIYSYPLQKPSYDSLLKKLLSSKQKIVNRKFSGIDIHEIKNYNNETQLVFTFMDGVFAVSKSSILIENAIRIAKSSDPKDFSALHQTLFHFPSLKSDQGNIYINCNPIYDLPQDISSQLRSIPVLKNFNNLAVYDLINKDGYIAMNGFSSGENSSLSLFQNQKPVPFRVAKYIPNNSDVLIHFGITDFDPFEIDTSQLKSFSIGNEIAFISSSSDKEKVKGIIEIENSNIEDFNFVTSYSETYSTYQIRGIDGESIKKAFNQLFPDVVFRFCALKDNYLLLAQTVDEVKSIIDAIESDDTWGKTSDYQKFSSKELQESNVTLIVKGSKVFSSENGMLNNYPQLVDSLGLKSIKWYSVQMSALDNHFYSNINILQGANPTQANTKASAISTKSILLPGTIKRGSLVKNHSNGLSEILVQDVDNWIYLVSINEGVLWKRQIEGQISGAIEQIDFYKNGKLQYFFVTENKIYLIDRLGRDVSGFPKSLSSSIKFANVVDYDKTRNYRYLTSLSDNQVYLLDKEGKNLSEWGPKKFNNEIAFSPRHFKLGGKDYFIVILNNGSVQIFNRRGDRVNNFKVANGAIFNGDYYIDSGLSMNESFLFYLTKDGALIKQSLNGQIRSSENLLRGKNSTFILKKVRNQDDFFIFRFEAENIAFFNRDGKLLFEKQNSGSTSLDFDCFATGNNKIRFSIIDSEQKLVQIIDETGQPLFPTPIESSVLPLIYSEKSGSKVDVYTFNENTIFINALH